MTTAARPGQICEPCFEAQSVSWVSQTWLYCAHHRVMARRRRASDPWTLDRRTCPEFAKLHITRALQKMEAFAAAKGHSPAEAYMMVQRLFERDKS